MVDQQQEDKPKWLLELESRKRKPKLAHETGAGAPCLSCESACPGLDLHFWRKICKNCKCRGDDHDFDDDEFPQFELLFGPNVKKNKKNRAVLLKVNDKKEAHAPETPFEWIPPDTTKELATDYMKALPTEKLPIKGSAGAALRRQQLQKQLPLHDIDHKACDGLSDQERKEFEKYLDNLKNCAGQGKVTKLMTMKPFDHSLMTPANATDVQRVSPQHSQQLSNPNGGLNLRTPSSFIPKVPQTHPKSDLSNLSNDVTNIPFTSNVDVITIQHLQAINEGNPRLGRYHHTLTNIPHNGNLAENINVPGAHHAGSHQLSKPINQNKSLSKNNLTSSELKYTKNPNYTASEEYVQSGTPQSASYHHTLTNMPNHSILAETASIPGVFHAPGHCLPNLNKENTSLIKPTSCDVKYSKNAGSIANEELTQNSALHTINEPTQGKLRASTEKIGNQIEQNLEFSSDLPSNALLAEQMLSEALLPPSAVHANDIVGSSLDEKGLMYIREKLNDKYSNKNDHQSAMQPRELDHMSHHPSFCNSEEVKRNIGKVTELENRSSYSNENNRNPLPSQLPYIACSERLPAQLNTSLPIQSNVIHSEVLNNPIFPENAIGTSVALQNPENINQLQEEMEGMTMNVSKAHKCHKCKEDIRCHDVVVTAEKIKDAVWHPGCFVCSACNELLVDLVYFTYKGKLYCARDLAKLLEIPRCFACDELIFVREYTVAEGHNYHVKHFCCWDCDIPLAGQQYISENDRPLCLPCYQKNYAKTCDACNNVIAADQQGVAIKNLNFHATDDCFCCFTCKKSLLGGQIAIKENKLLCSKECIAEFLHRKALGR